MSALLCLFLSLSREESQQKVEQSSQPAHRCQEGEISSFNTVTQDYRFLCFRHNTRKDLILIVFIVSEIKQKARVRAPTINMNTAL